MRLLKLAQCGLAAVLILTASTEISLAATDVKLLPSGVTHSVRVENRAPSGTRIVDQITSAGGVEVQIVTGTDDAEIEASPSIVVSRETANPVLVWSRSTPAGTEIQISYFDGDHWAAPKPLTANAVNDFAPVPVAAPSGLIHVMWKSMPAGATVATYYQSSVDSRGTPLPAVQISLPAGAAEPGSGLPSDGLTTSEILFAFDSGQKPQGPRLICFGGSDEPIPVIRRIDFILPQGSATVERLKIERVGSHPVLFIKQARTLTYTVGSENGWTPYRGISLLTMTEDKAELLIREMVESLGP